MTEEIDDIELFPEGDMGIFRQTVQSQGCQCFFLAFFQFMIDRDFFSSQYSQGQMEQILKQFAFPCVPYLRIGSANVGDGKKIQSGQIAFIADPFGKITDDVRIGQVFFLCELGQGQMLTNQKDDQFRIVLAQTVLLAKPSCILHTKK